MNRAERRKNNAINRKSAAAGYSNGRFVYGSRGALTGSNRSRPHHVYKKPIGSVKNTATSLLRALGVFL